MACNTVSALHRGCSGSGDSPDLQWPGASLCLLAECQEWERHLSWQINTPEKVKWKQILVDPAVDLCLNILHMTDWFGGEPVMVWGDIFGGPHRPPHASQSDSAILWFAASTAATSHQRLWSAAWCLQPGVEEITNHWSSLGSCPNVVVSAWWNGESWTHYWARTWISLCNSA